MYAFHNIETLKNAKFLKLNHIVLTTIYINYTKLATIFQTAQ